ncbi:MAG: restriction endonuclease [Acidobacteriota bacterium]
MAFSEALLSELLALAELGNVAAACRLGDLAYDQAKASEWYRKAAEQGYARAQVSLGLMYANGRGVQKDLKAATDWYWKAAEQGYGKGLLAFLSTSSDMTPLRTSKNALARFQDTASNGDLEAQCGLGVLYEHGLGVEKNPAVAAQLYCKAAMKGHQYARQRLEALSPSDNKNLLEYLRSRECADQRQEQRPVERSNDDEACGYSRPRTDEDVSQMSGQEFELLVKSLLARHGYVSIEMTPGSGDMGADLVVRHNERVIVIQCKRYSGAVGLQAVQEILGAKSFYQAHEAWVITNSTFTDPARMLARSGQVRLIDGEGMKKGGASFS